MSTVEPFLIIPMWVLGIEGITKTDAMMYGLIRGLSSKQPYCTAGNEYLGERLQLSDRQVTRCLNKLIELDLIEREVFKGGPKGLSTVRHLKIGARCHPRPRHGCQALTLTPMSPYNINKKEGLSPKKINLYPVDPKTGERLGSLGSVTEQGLTSTLEALGKDGPAEAMLRYWLWKIYLSGRKPKNLLNTIRTWHERKLADCYSFSTVGPAGADYYPNHKIKYFIEEYTK